VKRKIAMLAIGAMLAVALLGGGVYAYFSDTESSPGNQFAAGTLDLVLGGSGSSTISVSNMAPGSSGVALIDAQNVGTIGGTLTMTVSNLVDSEGTNPEPETNIVPPGDLSANVDLTLFIDVDHSGTFNLGDTTLWSGKLNALSGVNANCGTLAGGATMNVGVYYSVATSVGNDIMGDITTFDITFNLQQP